MSEREAIPWPEDETLASEPELDDASERALGEALRSAFAPRAIDARRHAELLAQALLDPFAPPSDDELRESERLRQALDAGDERHEDVRLLRALGAANEPLPAADGAREAAREVLARAPRAAKSNVLFVSFGVAAVAAAAALLVLYAGEAGRASPPLAERLVRSRSTAELFNDEFEQGGETERIDRIASARERDLRENRYALWGAR